VSVWRDAPDPSDFLVCVTDGADSMSDPLGK